jgi:hypothetical protein
MWAKIFRVYNVFLKIKKTHEHNVTKKAIFKARLKLSFRLQSICQNRMRRCGGIQKKMLNFLRNSATIGYLLSRAENIDRAQQNFLKFVENCGTFTQLTLNVRKAS